MEKNTLVTIMMPSGMFLGYLAGPQTEDKTVLTHVVSLSEPEQGTYLLTPEPFPMGLVDASVGKDMPVEFRNADAVMLCKLPLYKNSPHNIVKRFIEFWGLDDAA